MISLAQELLPATVDLPSDRQRLFILFFTGTLMDLAILGLFAEYSSKVYVGSFTITLLAAIVLQALLKLTIIAGRRLAALLRGKSGASWGLLKLLSAWFILFGSKFIILETLSFAFGDEIRFEWVGNGALCLTLVVFTMVFAEDAVAKFYRNSLREEVPAPSILPALPLGNSPE